MAGLTVFVTGGSGFTGEYLLKSLVERQDIHKVFTLSRSPSNFKHDKITWIQGDLKNLENFSEHICEADIVYHLGANASFSAQDIYQVNTQPIETFVKLLFSSKRIKKFIFVSSIGAVDRHHSDSIKMPLTLESIPHPRSEYGRSKLEAEKILQKSTLPWTIIRPTWVYGVGMRMDSHLRVLSNLVQNEKFISRMKFPGQVGLVHVDDLVTSLVNAIDFKEINNKIYFAQSEALTFAEIFNILGNAWSKETKVKIWVPPLKGLISKFHRFLPIQFSSLFQPYLVASAESWLNDFKVIEPKLFRDNAKDIANYEKQIQDGWHVVTGANSGIGAALTNVWENKNLVLIDRDTSNIIPKQNRIIINADLCRNDDLQAVVDKLSSLNLRTFINNAGIGFRRDTVNLSIEEMDQMLNVNIRAPIYLIQKLIQQLTKQKTSIVNIGSSVAFFPLPGMSLYAASKSALVSWSEALAVEIGKTNQVITFCPSGTLTQFQLNAGVKVTKSQKLKTPEAVAIEIDKSINTKKSFTYLPGGASKILYLVSTALPRRWVPVLWNKLFQSQR